MEKETKTEKASKKSTHTVAVQFVDLPEHQEGEKKTYNVGDDVSGLDPGRLALLVKRGIVTKSE